MLDDGERLVPGFRDARALRVWAGVRPAVPGREGRRHPRRHARPRGARPPQRATASDGFVTITGGKLTTLRLMAKDAVDAMCAQLGDDRPCRTHEVALPGSEDHEAYHIGERLASKERELLDDQLVCECELIPRARLEETMRARDTTNLDDIRRSLRLGMGPCQGGFCIYRATGHPARRRAARRGRGERVAAPLPAGALEGRLADPLRRPAAPGAPGRLDLPGRARRGAPAGVSSRGVSSPGWAAPSYDVLVIGAGRRGADRRGAARRGRGEGHADRQGRRRRRTSRRARSTCSGTRATSASSGRARRSARVDGAHPYARLGGADAVGARDRLVQAPVRRRPARRVRLPGLARGERPAADDRRRGEAVGGRAGDDGGGRPALERLDADRRLPRAARLPRAVPRRQRRARRRRRRGRSCSTGASTGARRPTASASRGRSTTPRCGPRSPREVARALDGAERVGFPAGLGAEDPHGVWSDLQERLGRPVFEIPTLPPSVPGMRVFRTLRDRLRRSGGRIILNSTVLSGARAGARIESVRATAAGREVDYRARWIVLATGGVATGGIALDSRWHARETALGLPLHGVPGDRRAALRPRVLRRAPVRARRRRGRRRPAPGRRHGRARRSTTCSSRARRSRAPKPWQEKSGDGLSLASGHRAAELILEEDDS